MALGSGGEPLRRPQLALGRRLADQEGDKTGGINRVFRYFYAARLKAKALKERNNPLYQALKWSIFVLVVVGIVLL